MSHEPQDEMHERFGEWLAQGAPGDPPRDAAVHAFVCPFCQRRMAAFDALTAIDPSHATLPPSRPSAVPAQRTLPTLRVAGAAAAMVVLGLVVSFGAMRLLASRATSVADTPGEPPVQAVLGGEGSPGPSIGQIGGEANLLIPSPTPAASASASAAATLPPSAAPNDPTTTRRPVATPAPATVPPPTRAPVATPTATPTVRPSASASPSVVPSASSTPPPTATPTPVPTPTATPAPTTPAATPTATAPPSASDAG